VLWYVKRHRLVEHRTRRIVLDRSLLLTDLLTSARHGNLHESVYDDTQVQHVNVQHNNISTRTVHTKLSDDVKLSHTIGKRQTRNFPFLTLRRPLGTFGYRYKASRAGPG